MKGRSAVLFAASLALVVAAGSAAASPAAMVGVTYRFGEDVGFTLKVLSSDQPDEVVGAIGASYYPWSKNKTLGFDLGGGYLSDNYAVTIGYDLLGKKPVFGLGYVDTDEDHHDPAPFLLPGGIGGGGTPDPQT